MQVWYFAMPSHPPERGLKPGPDWGLQVCTGWTSCRLGPGLRRRRWLLL